MGQAREGDFPSGPWTGFYQYQGRRLPHDFELTFDNGVIRGGGWDGVGEFVIKGSYDLESREVRWTKIYSNDHKLLYRGFREGKGIWGTWDSDELQGSGFHIWPLAEQDGPAQER